MNEVKWIKIKVGMFDGLSFRRIKKARIDGITDFRDKLTAVWFEILDLGAKVNNNGLLINDEIAFRTYEDIALMLDRTINEIELCFNFYIKEGMIEIIDDIYLISNWVKYQNVDGLDRVREQNRIRQQNYRERQKQSLLELKEQESVNNNVTVTLRNANPLKDNNISISKSSSISKSISISETTLKEKIKNKKEKVGIDEIKEIVEFLNQRLGTSYRYTTKKTQDLIRARMNEGFVLNDFLTVIDKKVREWKGTEWEKFLRPETLFSNKFEGYLQQPFKENKDDKLQQAFDRFLNNGNGNNNKRDEVIIDVE